MKRFLFAAVAALSLLCCTAAVYAADLPVVAWVMHNGDHEVVRRLGCRQEDICFYDDNLTAVSTAVKAGWYTCAVNDGQSEAITAALRAAANEYIPSFTQR